MNKSETLLALLLVSVLLCGIAWQNFRGGPSSAELIVAYQGGTPFDASSTPSPLEPNATLEPTAAPQIDAEIVFLNQATRKQLLELPGVGEVLVQRILEYRNSIGSFVRLEQLMEVNGIGVAKMEEIEAYLRQFAIQPTPSPVQLTPTIQPAQAPIEFPVSNYAPRTARLSLNRVSLQQLQEVPGIGPQLAKAILLERQRRKGFKSWSEIDSVPNIGPSRIQALKDRFTLE